MDREDKLYAQALDLLTLGIDPYGRSAGWLSAVASLDNGRQKPLEIINGRLIREARDTLGSTNVPSAHEVARGHLYWGLALLGDLLLDHYWHREAIRAQVAAHFNSARTFWQVAQGA